MMAATRSRMLSNKQLEAYEKKNTERKKWLTRKTQLQTISESLSAKCASLLPKLNGKVPKGKDRMAMALLERDPLLAKAGGGFRLFVRNFTDKQLIKCMLDPSMDALKQWTTPDRRYLHVLRNAWKSLTQFERMDWQELFEHYVRNDQIASIITSYHPSSAGELLEGPSTRNDEDDGDSERLQKCQWLSTVDSEHLPCPLCSFEAPQRFNIGQLLAHLSLSHYAVHLYACHCCSKGFTSIGALKMHADECRGFQRFVQENVKRIGDEFVFDFAYASLICAECGLHAILSPRCDQDALAQTLLNIILCHSSQSMALCLTFAAFELSSSSLQLRFPYPILLEAVPECPKCAKTGWETVVELERHCAEEHEWESVELAKCPECSASFYSALCARDHLLSKHLQQEVPQVTQFLRTVPLLPPALDKSGTLVLVTKQQAVKRVPRCEASSANSLKWAPMEQRAAREREARRRKRKRRQRVHSPSVASKDSKEEEEENGEEGGGDESMEEDEMVTKKSSSKSPADGTVPPINFGEWKEKVQQLERKVFSSEGSLDEFRAQFELPVPFSGQIIVQNTLDGALLSKSVFQCRKCNTIILGELSAKEHVLECHRVVQQNVSNYEKIWHKKVHSLFSSDNFPFTRLRCAICPSNSCSVTALRRHYAEVHAILCKFRRDESNLVECAAHLLAREWADTDFDRELHQIISATKKPKCTSELESECNGQQNWHRALTPSSLYNSLLEQQVDEEEESGREESNSQIKDEPMDEESYGDGISKQGLANITVKQEMFEDEEEDEEERAANVLLCHHQSQNQTELPIKMEPSPSTDHRQDSEGIAIDPAGMAEVEGTHSRKRRGRRSKKLKCADEEDEDWKPKKRQPIGMGRNARKRRKVTNNLSDEFEHSEMVPSSSSSKEDETDQQQKLVVRRVNKETPQMNWATSKPGGADADDAANSPPPMTAATYVCFMCTSSFKTTDAFSAHLRTHPENWSNCPICPTTNIDDGHNGGTAAAAECQKQNFDHPVQFFKHLNEQHMDVRHNQVSCPWCPHSLPFASKSQQSRAVAAMFRHLVYECGGSELCLLCGDHCANSSIGGGIDSGEEGHSTDGGGSDQRNKLVEMHREEKHRLIFDRFICCSCKCGFYSREQFLRHRCENALRCVCNPSLRFRNRGEYSKHFQQNNKQWKLHNLIHSDYGMGIDTDKRAYKLNDDYKRWVELLAERVREQEVDRQAAKAVAEIKKKFANRNEQRERELQLFGNSIESEDDEENNNVDQEALTSTRRRKNGECQQQRATPRVKRRFTLISKEPKAKHSGKSASMFQNLDGQSCFARRAKSNEEVKIFRILSQASRWVEADEHQQQRKGENGEESGETHQQKGKEEEDCCTAEGKESALKATVAALMDSIVSRVVDDIEGKSCALELDPKRASSSAIKDPEIVFQKISPKFQSQISTLNQQRTNSFHCTKCHMIFHTILALDQHKAMAHIEYFSLAMDTVSSLCRLCCIAFQDPARYAQHMKGHFPLPVACRQCSCVCGSEKEYESHKVLHNSDYICSFCLVRYTNELRLAYHIAKVHNKVLAYFCKSCGLCSTSLRSVLCHIFVVGQCTKNLSIDYVGVCDAAQLRFLPINAQSLSCDSQQLVPRPAVECRHGSTLSTSDEPMITCNDCLCPLPLSTWTNNFFSKNAPTFQYKEQCSMAEDDFGPDCMASTIFQLLCFDHEKKVAAAAATTSSSNANKELKNFFILKANDNDWQMKLIQKRLIARIQRERAIIAGTNQRKLLMSHLALFGAFPQSTLALTPMGGGGGKGGQSQRREGGGGGERVVRIGMSDDGETEEWEEEVVEKHRQQQQQQQHNSSEASGISKNVSDPSCPPPPKGRIQQLQSPQKSSKSSQAIDFVPVLKQQQQQQSTHRISSLPAQQNIVRSSAAPLKRYQVRVRPPTFSRTVSRSSTTNSIGPAAGPNLSLPLNPPPKQKASPPTVVQLDDMSPTKSGQCSSSTTAADEAKEEKPEKELSDEKGANEPSSSTSILNNISANFLPLPQLVENCSSTKAATAESEQRTSPPPQLVRMSPIKSFAPFASKIRVPPHRMVQISTIGVGGAEQQQQSSSSPSSLLYRHQTYARYPPGYARFQQQQQQHRTIGLSRQQQHRANCVVVSRGGAPPSTTNYIVRSPALSSLTRTAPPPPPAAAMLKSPFGNQQQQQKKRHFAAAPIGAAFGQTQHDNPN